MNCQLIIAHDRPSPRLVAELSRLAELWADGLARFGGPWLAGERFTAVDAFYAPVAVRVRGYQLELPESAMAYVERQLSYAPVAEWVDAGIHESLAEPHHHADCVRQRRIVADLANPANPADESMPG